MRNLFCTAFLWIGLCLIPSTSLFSRSLSAPPGTQHLNPASMENTASRLNADILRYINEMRKDPAAFYRKYLPDYIESKKERFTAQYTRSLKKAMLSAGPLPLFETSPALVSCASRQLHYLSQFGGRQLTHEQGNVSFAERMKNAGLHCLAENLYDADDPEALDVVLDLLIDQHVPSFGHRLNLMNALYTKIGVVSGTPPGGRTIVVMDFGCKN